MKVRISPVMAVVAMIAMTIATLSHAPSTASAVGHPVAAMQVLAKMDRNCADFNTQAAAQRYFIERGGPRQDPDGLDADGDGIACESNPCPCSTDKSGGRDGAAGGGGTPKLNIDIRIANVRGKSVLRGDISPRRNYVVVQKGTRCNAARSTCNFKRFKRIDQIRPGGKFQTRVQTPRTGSFAWRAVYRGTASDIWVTCRKKPGRACPTPR